MYRSKAGRTPEGTWPLVSNPKDGFVDLTVQIPCGRCIFCRLNTSMGKTIRLTHELEFWDTAAFLTLTYEDKHLPLNDAGVPTLTRGQSGDMTLFIKRLRDRIDVPIKIFQCGEYGEKYGRPHHHAIIYGYDFSEDRSPVSSDGKLFSSQLLNDCWKKGECVIGSVTWDSASYVASYSTKKLVGDDAKQYDILDIEPPYMTSSLGVGKRWIEKWLYDVYPRDWIAVKGHKFKPPRYYDKVLEEKNPEMYKKVIKAREDHEYPEDYFKRGIAAMSIKEKQLEFFKNPKL